MRRALSIIEVVVAVAVVSIALLSLGQLVVSLEQSNASASEQAVALTVCSQRLEELKALDFDAVLALDASPFPVRRSIDGRSVDLKADPSPGPDGKVWTQPGRIFVSPIGGGDFARVVLLVRYRTVHGRAGVYRLVWGRGR